MIGFGELADGVNALISLGRGDVAGATLSAMSMVPVVGDAIGKGGKILRAGFEHGDEVLEAGTKLLDVANNTGKIKTYQTYTKKNPLTGEVYSGRTSGYDDPRKNILNRDRNHHKNKEGFEEAVLDMTSTNKDAIRGREQQLIEIHGGAKSTGGTSGNAINRISPNNHNKDKYINASIEEFGE